MVEVHAPRLGANADPHSWVAPLRVSRCAHRAERDESRAFALGTSPDGPASPPVVTSGTSCAMSEELVLVALRVLACSAIRRQQPDHDDVARLREAVAPEERDWEVETLAAHIVEREVRHRRARRLAAATAACGR